MVESESLVAILDNNEPPIKSPIEHEDVFNNGNTASCTVSTRERKLSGNRGYRVRDDQNHVWKTNTRILQSFLSPVIASTRCSAKYGVDRRRGNC